MKAKTLSIVMVVSFILCAMTIAKLGIAFWLSLAVFAWTCLYAERHAKRLGRELDDMFGQDEELK